MRLHEATLHFTISLGVAQWQPDESLLFLMRRADEALYLAKYNGRNRIETADERVRWGALEPGKPRDQNKLSDSSSGLP